MANALTTNATESSLQEAMLADKLDRIWRCTAEMIAKAAEDKVPLFENDAFAKHVDDFLSESLFFFYIHIIAIFLFSW